jgi:hypothetical protein
MKQKLLAVAAALRNGNDADIFFDAHLYPEEAAKAETIKATQKAMLDAASILETLASADSRELKTVLACTDWTLLSKQKLALVAKATDGAILVKQELADGLLHFLDAIQDAVVADGIAQEALVFSAQSEEI